MEEIEEQVTTGPEQEPSGQGIQWSPDEKIEITGLEFESLVRTLELFEKPLNSFAVTELSLLFSRVSTAARDILNRMREEGKLL